MKFRSTAAVFIACAIAAVTYGDEHWPQFRGHGGLGIGSGNPPTTWDVQTERNVAWRTAIPGLGHSAPIVWGNRVFLTTAVNASMDTPALETGWSGLMGESAKDTGPWSWKVMCLELRPSDCSMRLPERQLRRDPGP